MGLFCSGMPNIVKRLFDFIQVVHLYVSNLTVFYIIIMIIKCTVSWFLHFRPIISQLNETCNFPWVCSNAWDLNDNEPLGGCDEFIIIDKTNEGGPRILTLGLIEQAWLDSLSSVDPGNITFEHPWDYVKRRVPEIQAEFGPFDMVLAATHMRMPNDIKLAEHGGVDIILGGHDHHYEDIVVNDIRILNSSTDFKAFTVVDVNGRNGNGSLDTTARRLKVEAGEEPDQQLADEISGFQAMVNESMNEVVGKSKVRLDARFSEVRTKETNIGNFLAELMARSTGADIGFLNSGTIRADRFVEPGQLIMKDLCDLLVSSHSSRYFFLYLVIYIFSMSTIFTKCFE